MPRFIDERIYRCDGGHAFDMAREGYVNLLAGRPLRGRHRSGDGPDMVRARRDFLDVGHFEPLRSLALSFVPDGSVLDLGCGEGYYSRPLEHRRAWIGGIDVAKVAVRLASRRAPGIHYAVGNAFDLPVVTGSIDTILDVFGPVAAAEMRRTLTRSGRVVSVVPAPTHLIELKHLLLAEPELHPERGPAGFEAFHLAHSERLTYEMQVWQPHLDALRVMTPYRWLSNQDRAQALSDLDRLTVTADFSMRVYTPD